MLIFHFKYDGVHQNCCVTLAFMKQTQTTAFSKIQLKSLHTHLVHSTLNQSQSVSCVWLASLSLCAGVWPSCLCVLVGVCKAQYSCCISGNKFTVLIWAVEKMSLNMVGVIIWRLWCHSRVLLMLQSLKILALDRWITEINWL